MSVVVISDDILKGIMSEDVDEHIYAAQKVVPVAVGDLETDTVPGGYVGVIMGLAVNFDASTTYFLKVADKDRWENGIGASGLSSVAVGNGVGSEVPVLEFVDDGKKWQFQGRRVAGALAQNYMLRVRYYKKGSKLVG
ncbi:hypothetical protein MUP59_02025 [Candidatus Bathyarchaeota archaeon]|nr:hypothetical protein [Candidatus Bathyarchaeota archaeon]